LNSWGETYAYAIRREKFVTSYKKLTSS